MLVLYTDNIFVYILYGHTYNMSVGCFCWEPHGNAVRVATRKSTQPCVYNGLASPLGMGLPEHTLAMFLLQLALGWEGNDGLGSDWSNFWVDLCG